MCAHVHGSGRERCAQDRSRPRCTPVRSPDTGRRKEGTQTYLRLLLSLFLFACTGVTGRVPFVASTMRQGPAALCPAAPPAGCGAMKPGSVLTAAATPAGTTATQQQPARPVSTASSTGTHPSTAQPCCPTGSGSSGLGSQMRPQQRSSTRAGQTRQHLLTHDSWLQERLLLLAGALLPLLRHRRLLGRTAGRWGQLYPSRHHPGQASLNPRP